MASAWNADDGNVAGNFYATRYFFNKLTKVVPDFDA